MASCWLTFTNSQKSQTSYPYSKRQDPSWTEKVKLENNDNYCSAENADVRKQTRPIPKKISSASLLENLVSHSGSGIEDQSEWPNVSVEALKKQDKPPAYTDATRISFKNTLPTYLEVQKNAKATEYQPSHNNQNQEVQVSKDLSESTEINVLIEDVIPLQEHPIIIDAQTKILEEINGSIYKENNFAQIMCALNVLKLILSDDVADFEIAANNNQSGDIDDIELGVKFADESSRRYLFQLKHEKKGKPIKIKEFLSSDPKSAFLADKSFKTLLQIEVEEDPVYIFYTNSPINIKGYATSANGIAAKKCNKLEFENIFLNLPKKSKDPVFQITSKDVNQKCYFFTKQMNVNQAEDAVKAILQELLHCDIFSSFEEWMKNFWTGNYVLSKQDFVAKMTELAFLPHIKSLTEKKVNGKAEALKELIMKFQLTLIEHCDEEIVENIWKLEEICTEEMEQAKQKYRLEDDQKHLILWYLDKVPLIVAVDDGNELMVQSVIYFLEENVNSKKIILIGKVDRWKHKSGGVFENLEDIKRKKDDDNLQQIMQTFKISLHGRYFATLEDLVSKDADIASSIGTRELLKMSQLEYGLVGKKIEERKKYDCYIPRKISPIFVQMEDIVSTYKLSHDTLLIINCDENFEKKLSVKRDVNTMELSQYMYGTTSEKPQNLIILSTRGKCTNLQFEKICEDSKKPNVYLLQAVDDETCILLLSLGRQLRCQFRDARKEVKESEIFKYYNNALHVICGLPGTGKSTLMETLYNSCPSGCLSIHVTLIDHNSFLATKPNFGQILARFLQINDTQYGLFQEFKEHLLEKQKLYMFLDGLDGLDSTHIERILSFVKELLSRGGNVWVSSRDNLRNVICQRLNVVPIDIKELDEKEHRFYIDSRLKGSYTTEERETVSMAVFGDMDGRKGRDLMGAPMKLYMLSEILLHDRQNYENLEKHNFSVLTQMYKTFFKGKIKTVDPDPEKQSRFLERSLESYELISLKTCLDAEDYEKLHIDEDLTSFFLLVLKNKGDWNGLINRINGKNQAIFEHQTYAEYFACVWFSKHRDKLALLRDKIFLRRYDNLRLIFDIMMSENNPLHLAVIYQDLGQFEDHIGREHNVDEAGRTALHLACSYGHRYHEVAQRETPCYVNMTERLLQNGKAAKTKDELFDLSCVDYAIRSECLYPIDRMLDKKMLTFGKLKKLVKRCHNEMDFATYSAQVGYFNLLTESIRKHRSLKKELRNGNNLLELAAKGCDGDVVCTPPRDGNVEAFNTLIKSSTNLKKLRILEYACMEKCFDMLDLLIEKKTKCRDGNTILHILVTRCADVYYNEIVDVIKKFNIDVNAKNNEGYTALHVAVESAGLKIIQALLENGADLHTPNKDKQSPLHQALLKSRQDIIKLFLDSGLQINRQDEDGTTMLHLASQEGKTEIVKMLFQENADPKLVDKENNNALHYALRSERDNQDTIELLQKNGVDVNARNDEGFAPIHVAYKAGNFKNADFLLQMLVSSEVNAKLADGKTSLHLACEDHQRLHATGLLERGADPNVLDNDKKNPLHYYLLKFYAEDVIHSMVTHGIHINTPYMGGKTLLHIVCCQGDTRNVKQLVEKFGQSFNLNMLNDEKQNALHTLLESFDHTEQAVRDRLINRHKYGIDVQHEHESKELVFGCEGCYHELVRDLPIPEDERFRETFRTVLGGDDKMDIFLKYVPTSNFASKSVFMTARIIIFGLVNYLVENGLKMEEVDDSGKTALDYASKLKKSFPEITNLLKSYQTTN